MKTFDLVAGAVAAPKVLLMLNADAVADVYTDTDEGADADAYEVADADAGAGADAYAVNFVGDRPNSHVAVYFPIKASSLRLFSSSFHSTPCQQVY